MPLIINISVSITYVYATLCTIMLAQLHDYEVSLDRYLAEFGAKK